MLLHLRDRPTQKIVHAVVLRQKLQKKLSDSPSHSMLTSVQPVPALTLWRQPPGRVATGVPIFESLVWLDLEKDPWQKRESNSGLRFSRLMPYHWAYEVVVCVDSQRATVSSWHWQLELETGIIPNLSCNCDFEIGYLMAILPAAWYCRASGRAGCFGFIILWVGAGIAQSVMCWARCPE